MRRMLTAGLASLLAVAAPLVLTAQVGGRRERVPPQDRAALDQRFQQRLATFMQKQLGLNDEQTRRMSEVNQKYEARRMDLVRRERDARVAMRKQLMDSTGVAPNEDRVAQLLQDLGRMQHERLDLNDAEQADLAKFLTPSQRAKYLGIQEQMRRRIEQFRDRPQWMDDPAQGPGLRGRGMNPRMNRRPPG
jgi:periplasmic protein CpxP/Spy